MATSTPPLNNLSGRDYQHEALTDNMPVFYEALKTKLNFPLAWSPAVSDLSAWRQAGRDKMWQLTLQSLDHTPFDAQIVSEVDRGSYVARKVVFNLTAESRVQGLMLVPKGTGPFPAALMLHDHGSKFDIGKEKWIETWDDEARLHSSRAWAQRYFSSRFPGDTLAKRGYVVLALDALGFGERGTFTYEMQQAVAANAFNLGSSLAGIMALEDTRGAAFLAAQPEVCPSQVAAIGFSMGGFRAWQAAALSDKITAAIAVNWMSTAASLMVPGNNQLRGNSAWNILHPGALRYLDFPDVASLAAPKAMLLLATENDDLFPLTAVKSAFSKMHQVWHAWGAANKLDTRILPGAHEYLACAQEASFDWLDREFGRTQ